MAICNMPNRIIKKASIIIVLWYIKWKKCSDIMLLLHFYNIQEEVSGTILKYNFYLNLISFLCVRRIDLLSIRQ